MVGFDGFEGNAILLFKLLILYCPLQFCYMFVFNISISREELKQVLEELLDKQIEPLRKSIEFLSAQYDKFHSQLKNNKTNIKILIADNKALKSDAATMKKIITDLPAQVDAQEQYSRRVSGVQGHSS